MPGLCGTHVWGPAVARSLARASSSVAIFEVGPRLTMALRCFRCYRLREPTVLGRNSRLAKLNRCRKANWPRYSENSMMESRHRLWFAARPLSQRHRMVEGEIMVFAWG